NTPYAPVEPTDAAMQRVAVVVGVGLEALAVEDELSAGDAVGVTADDRPEIERMVEIIHQPLEAQHQRRMVTFEAQVPNDRPIGQDVRRQPAPGDSDLPDALAVGCCSEGFSRRHSHPPLACLPRLAKADLSP